MATDLTLYLDDQPGELAQISGLLGAAGVSIQGFCAVTSGGGKAEVHLLVDDMAAAFSALDAGGIQITSEQEVAVVPVVDDRPGILGEISRKLGESGINITVAYLATNTRLVFGADDLAAARAALD
jgi:hypothetical protein